MEKLADPGFFLNIVLIHSFILWSFLTNYLSLSRAFKLLDRPAITVLVNWVEAPSYLPKLLDHPDITVLGDWA